ncbi:Hypothetical predicted protein [Mytilus galloprovincialis]|uniref:Uncharacterized protein n=2 Tax=Mytilus galloprovincialis TaxID=29158 RepID=A0A8B6DZB8_MYTGA|nr:Hypothetical predicted protein [Mytilus galloprovincialis]
MFIVKMFLVGIAVIHVLGKNEEKTCSADNKDTCDPCGITGKWMNELGSVVEITCKLDSPDQSSTGEIIGKYNSAVGAATDYYPLSGRFTIPDQDSTSCIVGFVVAWNNKAYGNADSSTSFTGTYYKDTDKIYTFWILTSYKKYNDMWENSNIGKDVFTRIHSK